MSKKSELSPEQKHLASVERIAFRVYQNRLKTNRDGDAASDWQEATKIVKSPLRRAAFLVNRPFMFLEKHLFKPFSSQLKRSAVFYIIDRLIPLLEVVGVIGIPFVLYFATQSYEQQQKEQGRTRLQQAEAQEIERLQQESVQNYIAQISEVFLNIEGDIRADENERIRTLTTATTIALLRDPNLDGARKGQIIEFLGQMGLVQGFENADQDILLPIISLLESDLSYADLIGADLSFATLYKADLSDANLSEANLRYTNLVFANLSNTDLIEVNFSYADLGAADLSDANLIHADLRYTDLSDATLSSADLGWTTLSYADLRYTDLSDANLGGTIILATDLSEAQNLTQAQLEGKMAPHICNSLLPRTITTVKDRDCDKIAQLLRERFPADFRTLEDAQEYVDDARQISWE